MALFVVIWLTLWTRQLAKIIELTVGKKATQTENKSIKEEVTDS
jgi:hypothetical protein